MTRTRRSMLRAGCGALAGGLFAGCIGSSPSSDSDTETRNRSPTESASPEDTVVGTDTEPPTTTPRTTETHGATTDVMTPGTTAVNRGCNGARGLSFKPHNGMIVWNRRSVQVGGFSLDSNANVLLVVYEGDTVLGTAESHAPPGGTMVVDGESIPLDEPLTGEHTIRVVMYADPDGDGTFEPESATPCRYEGSVIQAGPETIDFSAFSPGTSTTP